MTLRTPSKNDRHPILISILAGALGMLLAARLTGSVLVGWMTFVVVCAVAGVLVWKVTAPSRAAEKSEQPASPSAARAATPRPLEIINRNYAEINRHYADERRTMTPEFAARSALGRALDSAVRDEVIAYYDGERDDAYGDGSGARVREALVESLEAGYVVDDSEAVAAA